MKARKKPVEVNVWRFTGRLETDPTSPDWVLADRHVRLTQDGKLEVPTLEGKKYADRYDWIIQGVEGELYPCNPSVFDKTYDLVES